MMSEKKYEVVATVCVTQLRDNLIVVSEHIRYEDGREYLNVASAKFPAADGSWVRSSRDFPQAHVVAEHVIAMYSYLQTLAASPKASKPATSTKAAPVVPTVTVALPAAVASVKLPTVGKKK